MLFHGPTFTKRKPKELINYMLYIAGSYLSPTNEPCVFFNHYFYAPANFQVIVFLKTTQVHSLLPTIAETNFQQTMLKHRQSNKFMAFFAAKTRNSVEFGTLKTGHRATCYCHVL